MDTTENSAAPAGTETPAAAAPTKKRRLLKYLAIGAGTFIAFSLLFTAFGLGSVAKWAINSVGAKILGVDKMSVETFVLRPFGGYLRIENFVIGHPIAEGKDFSRDLMSLDYLEFDFETLTALSRKKIIRALVLKNLRLNYEQLISGSTNVGTLAARFTSPESKKSDKPAKTETDAVPAEEIYVAARFVDIDGVRVCIYAGDVPSPLPPISVEFPEGLGLDEDLTPTQFGLRFAGNFVSVFRLLRASGISGAAGVAVGALTDAAGAAANTVSDVAGATAGAVSGAASATTGAVLDAGKAVFDIFSDAKKKSGENSDAVEK